MAKGMGEKRTNLNMVRCCRDSSEVKSRTALEENHVVSNTQIAQKHQLLHPQRI